MTRYALHSRWTLRAPRHRVWELYDEMVVQPDPMPWWRSVDAIQSGDGELHVVARSVFGYTVRFRVLDLRDERPGVLRLRADGDLVGHGQLTFHEDGQKTKVDILWDVRPTPGWMLRASRWLRPVFVAGHHLVMAQGERQVNAWLADRR